MQHPLTRKQNQQGNPLKVFSNMTAIILALATSGMAYAHHSVLPFDHEKFSVLEGVVSEVRWRNPHIRLKLLVENEAGEKEEWDIEGGAANVVARKGVTKEDVSVGDRIRIGGWPSKLGRQELFVVNLLLPDGRETIMLAGEFPLRWTEQRPEVVDLPADADLERTIFRAWGFAELYKPRAPFVFTASAQAARAEWEPFTDMLAIQCVAPGMPNAILNPYPIEFIDEGDQIRLRIEEWEATRIIDMMSEEVPDDAPSSLYGYSVGRWVDGVLVIETENVDFPYLDDDGTPMSEQAKIVERFTVSDDGARLDYEVSVTDPENLVEPATWDAAWKYVPGTRIMPFECDPD
jgi:hypothetical protein